MDDIYGECIGETLLCNELGVIREEDALGVIVYTCTGFRHYSNNSQYIRCSNDIHKKENVMEALNPGPQGGNEKSSTTVKDEVISRYATWRLATEIVDELFALVDVTEYKYGPAFGPWTTTTVLDQRLEATIRCANWLMGED